MKGEQLPTKCIEQVCKVPTRKQALYTMYILSDIYAKTYLTVKRTQFKVINYVSLCEDYPSEEEQNIHQEDGKSKPL